MKILNIAHRGYSGKFDENTMIAFRKAIEYKADGIETDVQLSKDNIPIIIHDETLDRTTNGKGYVKDYTLEELKKFRTKNGEEIPTLKELLEFAVELNIKVLNLELKNSIFPYEGLEEKVLEMIYEYNLKEKIIISSFNHLSLVKIRRLDNEIRLGALTDSTLVNVPKYLKDISVECYHPCFPSILNDEYMKEIKEAGIVVNPYTVNKEEHMKMVIKVRPDSIITNEIEKLYNLLNKCKK
ncbi:glycerophosphodiester phosphodiesterase [Clostridium sp.]|uniref:glycerophosphodiester phosphodiesterase n=1 Tax=Clostridium sp. TaxID=1506 RepID=UPI00283AEAAB|nr:glycerophosphodiester phosphodiesterase [Clostridium sp.]MDR3595386.1 glycerophosphodiester phosphodiesterase [Clostridium sp.]